MRNIFPISSWNFWRKQIQIYWLILYQKSHTSIIFQVSMSNIAFAGPKNWFRSINKVPEDSPRHSSYYAEKSSFTIILNCANFQIALSCAKKVSICPIKCKKWHKLLQLWQKLWQNMTKFQSPKFYTQIIFPWYIS